MAFNYTDTRNSVISAVYKITEDRRKEVQHVFFLKVHKACSTTMMNLLLRFAHKRQLNVMFPKSGSILSQTSKYTWQRIIDLPPNITHFDIICNHLVFDKKKVLAHIHPDSKFVGIVRNPLDLTVSAFNYYRYKWNVKYVAKVPGVEPLKTYFQSPAKWEPDNFGRSFTHNRMSFDFGMDERGLQGDNSSISSYITYLNETFDLVMICERFDESLLLLKHMMNWDFMEIMYIKNNGFSDKIQFNKIALNDTEKRLHRELNAADYVLYDFFANLFQRKVERLGKPFKKELIAYKSLLRQMNDFCLNGKLDYIEIGSTTFSKRFNVTSTDCKHMTMKAIEIVKIFRSDQLKQCSAIENKKKS